MTESQTMRQIFDYFEYLNFSVTVCDREGIVVYQNICSKANDGDVVGKNLFRCHSQKTGEKIRQLMEMGESNTYEIIKHGKRFLVKHTPWCEETGGVVSGLIELVIDLPDNYPVFDRDKKK